jgi:Domain of unknown function (DUF4440)
MAVTPETPTVGLALCAALFGMTAAAPIAAAEGNATAAGCARQFEEAQRIDMESFRDFDEATWLAGHHPEAITIFASGARRQGIDSIAATMHSHFVNKTAVWSWTELYRFVDGCSTGYILYDATYDIPSIGFHQRALTSVTYIHQGGRWLSIADQGTLLP